MGRAICRSSRIYISVDQFSLGHKHRQAGAAISGTSEDEPSCQERASARGDGVGAGADVDVGVDVDIARDRDRERCGYMYIQIQVETEI